MADWQHGQMCCSSVVCPLTSPKCAPASAPTCHRAASSTASSLLCLLLGTITHMHLTHKHSCVLSCAQSPLFPTLCFRLARLLGHSFVLKPQYDFSACDRADMWPAHGQLITALNDPLLIEASCPLSVSGVLPFMTTDSHPFLSQSSNLNLRCHMSYAIMS